MKETERVQRQHYILTLEKERRIAHIVLEKEKRITHIFYSSKNIEDLIETLNSELKYLKKWLQGNKLSLNVIKTQAMVIGSRPNLKKISEKNCKFSLICD